MEELACKNWQFLINFFYYNTNPVVIFKDKTTRYEFSKYQYAGMSENRDTRWDQIREYNLYSNYSLSAGE
jgi:hypothetical protein